MITILLYGYLPFVIVSLLSAGWFAWFSKDPKRGLGVIMALAFAFLPLLNIYWTLLIISDVFGLKEIKHPLYNKLNQKIWFTLIAIISIAYGVPRQWQHLKQKFIN